MKHKFYYKTRFGGWVCKCYRYFDTEEELADHITKRVGHITEE